MTYMPNGGMYAPPSEFWFEWLEALRIHLLLVHAARIEVADLLLIRARHRLTTGSHLLKNLVQVIAVAFYQLVSRSPIGIGRWYIDSAKPLGASSGPARLRTASGLRGF
jgi:hypothetical protein